MKVDCIDLIHMYMNMYPIFINLKVPSAPHHGNMTHLSSGSRQEMVIVSVPEQVLKVVSIGAWRR